jgi:hypothetical protein
VRTAYLNWLPGRRLLHHEVEDVGRRSFPSAVGVLLGAGADEERRLVDLLNGEVRSTDLRLSDDGTEEYSDAALGSMAAIALSWLHRKRRQEQGQPVATLGFPELPDWAAGPHWPPATVPAAVLEAARSGAITLPLDAIQLSQPLHLEADNSADLFYDDPGVPRSAVPPPVLPDAPQHLIWDQAFDVPENKSDVPSGIRLKLGDDFALEGSGRIWAGVIGTGENGPNGWDRIEYDRKFPLTGRPNGHPYCLLGKMGESGAYFFIGEHRARERYLDEDLRTNCSCVLMTMRQETAAGDSPALSRCGERLLPHHRRASILGRSLSVEAGSPD